MKKENDTKEESVTRGDASESGRDEEGMDMDVSGSLTAFSCSRFEARRLKNRRKFTNIIMIIIMKVNIFERN